MILTYVTLLSPHQPPSLLLASAASVVTARNLGTTALTKLKRSSATQATESVSNGSLSGRTASLNI